MSDDIVTRLRHMAWTAPEGEPWADALRDAADQIERLRAEVGHYKTLYYKQAMEADCES